MKLFKLAATALVSGGANAWIC